MSTLQPIGGGGARHRCPTCGATVSWADNPARPFCSLTCKLVDLGVWLDDNYRLAGDPLPGETMHDPRAPEPERRPADE
jgi:endogenous inhibitor of DNA gyrase (YacG/DUF329 family)